MPRERPSIISQQQQTRVARPPASAAGTITVQVLAFLTLIVGIYILTITRDAPPGCGPGLRAVLGRSHVSLDGRPVYQLCDVDEKDPV